MESETAQTSSELHRNAIHPTLQPLPKPAVFRQNTTKLRHRSRHRHELTDGPDVSERSSRRSSSATLGGGEGLSVEVAGDVGEQHGDGEDGLADPQSPCLGGAPGQDGAEEGVEALDAVGVGLAGPVEAGGAQAGGSFGQDDDVVPSRGRVQAGGERKDGAPHGTSSRHKSTAVRSSLALGRRVA
jgi:hypothetical protein